MLIDRRYDSRGNIVYEEYSDGYIEYNEYNKSNQLLRSECHYSNGIVEMESFCPLPGSKNFELFDPVVCL